MRKIELAKPQAIIFDMDGTLLETETLLKDVHDRLFVTLNKEGLYTKPAPPSDRLLGCLGMLLEDIWKTVMPDSSEQARERADELLLQYEIEDLRAGKGLLYPDVEATLTTLKKQGIKLFVASNGLEDYVKEIVRCKNLEHLFDGLYSAGEYQTKSKVDLVALLLKEHHLDYGWMVGDRSSDVEAGHKNSLSSIGCAYAGYGKQEELVDADAHIQHFPELLELLANCMKQQ